ncbi:MAG: HAD family hydrolase [Chloroflexi bacterium]|nr:HAD family hydrolase [Chloroflexota bacterium]MDA1003240.1 HAD family hydrolase [Chloroflexota bacterium]
MGDDQPAHVRILGVERLVVSFDIDGTLEFGDPNGPVVSELVRTLQRAQVVVGSASDRTVLDQRRVWAAADLEPAFVVVKNHLRFVPERHPSDLLIHVGDRFADELEAANAGAVFVHVDALSWEEWLEPHHFYRAAHASRGT